MTQIVTGESSRGPTVKRILNETLRSNLSEGDIISEVNRKNVLECSAATVATMLESEEGASFLVDRESPDMVMLEKAIKQGDCDGVNHVLETDVNINSCIYESSRTLSRGYSALMIASEQGQLEVTKLLLETWKADVVNQDGWSALMVACLNGHYDVAKLLLKKAIVNFQNSDGWSALMFACKEGHLRVTELLLDNGADVDLQDSKGWSPLMVACEKNHLELVKITAQRESSNKLAKG